MHAEDGNPLQKVADMNGQWVKVKVIWTVKCLFLQMSNVTSQGPAKWYPFQGLVGLLLIATGWHVIIHEQSGYQTLWYKYGTTSMSMGLRVW